MDLFTFHEASLKLIPLLTIPFTLLFPAASVLFYVLIREEWQHHSTHLRLAESEKRYRTLVESLREFVYSFDLSGNLITANAHMLEVLNVQSDQIIGKSIDNILHSQKEKSKWMDAYEQVIETEHFVGFESQLYWDGMPHIYSIKFTPIFDSNLKLTGVLGIHHEITELKHKEEQIEYLVFHDPLTELPNRSLFHKRLQKDLQQSRASNAKVAVAFLDFDRFKQINDKDDIVPIIRRMQEALDQPVLIKGKLCYVKGSFGVSFYPDDAASGIELLKQADTAMYFAKKHEQSSMAEILQQSDGSA